MEYYSEIKKNEILSFETTWMELEIIMLNKEQTRPRKRALHDFIHMWNLTKLIS
jgi:hypothetical protein